MYIRCMLGAIFIIFILCVHCDNSVNYNESKEIYVPSAPQNLTVNRVTSEDIHLSWAPPTTFTHHFIPNPEPKATADNTELQGDEPMKNDLPAIRAETLTNFETIIDSYKKDKLKYNDEFPLPDIMNDYRIRRDLRSHRHRKRRQDVNATDTRTTHAEKHDLETHEAIEFPIEVVKKSFTPVYPHKDATQIAYVLYFEQGVPKIDASTVIGVPSSADVKKMNYFPSDLGMADYSKATKNLTLLNTAGVLTKVVGFRLRNLKPFTPYKIWVRAFYNFSLQGVKSSDLLDRLGPQSEPLYVLTDVLPPSAPVILNLTCDQPHDILYLQWRQPLEYNNSLDQYVVTLRKLPEQQPRLAQTPHQQKWSPTRVKLEWLVWRRRYIATQGPTPHTLDAFWRMIWQHKVHTVVMITNLVERGRRKCDMYWPGGGRGSSAEFGGVHVTLLHEDVRAAYTVRHMRVRNQNHKPESSPPSPLSEEDAAGRMVVQYHYTVWPDHGTPRHPLAVLPFVQAAAADPGTVLVHCSAGVGRTGTYIVLDAQLNQLKLTGTLSPLGFLCRARTQRNHLVQTEEQYVFVHDALLEHVRSGNTEVPFTEAREYLVKLLQPISEDELAVLDLNPPKHKSINDLTNGIENGDTASLKSSKDETDKDVVENGSQLSIKTDDLNSEQSKSVKEDEDVKEVMTNGDESEGVYDLGPRSTDTYSKKMQAYNNMTEQEKEELRRANRAENYALLERMRSLANRNQSYQGPPPVNLLEKQFLLIMRSCVEPSVCARAPHNIEKNRPGAALPSDTARVMLVPKPGVEGSEYVNASWVCGRRRLREYAVTQHPPAGAAPELWRLLWDHTAQLVLTLAAPPAPDCETFWPTEDEKELFVANFRASFVSKDTYVAYRKSARKSTPAETPAEPETNGYRRQESDCADDERLIPENGSPVADTEPAYRFDRTELRLERLSAGNRDLSTRKSIANGDLFSSFSEKKSGPKSPRSPSKMSLKNFKLSSPTKFKFPDWGSRAAGSPPDVAPPPPPVAPSLTVEEEAELRRPFYRFEKVDKVPENIPSDRVIEVTNVSVHSLQDDYQLSVKFIQCSGWLEGDTTEYCQGKPDENEFVRAVREATSESERAEAVDRLIAPYKDSFALIEFVAGCQMEYKNGPVVVVDKHGDWKAMSFCTLSAACGGARAPDARAQFRAPADDRASLYTWGALCAHARCSPRAPSPRPLLAQYCALAAYHPS
ncbi:LOW QUALITY PROTEIN: uncharacterized protein [Choristoneura fumiferana]|uniref:LOW QUALITY PROTEIN: uncharacterized protein n=1 Tax=Choristoneura fumiferana TaxID=7141 RepID=UPI003D1577AA